MLRILSFVQPLQVTNNNFNILQNYTILMKLDLIEKNYIELYI